MNPITEFIVRSLGFDPARFKLRRIFRGLDAEDLYGELAFRIGKLHRATNVTGNIYQDIHVKDDSIHLKHSTEKITINKRQVTNLFNHLIKKRSIPGRHH